MNDAAVANGGHRDTRVAQPARVRLALVSQHVSLGGEDEGEGEPRELLEVRAQR